MMHAANVPTDIRYRLCGQAVKTAALLDGLIVVDIAGNKMTRFEHWNGKLPAFAKHLRTWGEAGTVKVKDKSTPKIADRGIQCMFVGYSPNHNGDCYDMWNPKTGGVHQSRDVIWLKRMYYTGGTPKQPDGVLNDFETPDNGAKAGKGAEQQVTFAPGTDTEPYTTRYGRTVMPPVRLTYGHCASRSACAIMGLTEPEAAYYEAMQTIEGEVNNDTELICVGAGIGGGFETTEELHVKKF